MALNPHVKICTHVMVTGVRCGSPALRGAKFCYFHERMLNGVPTPKHARIHPIAILENEEAIQVALMEVINAVLRNAIDNRRASLILRALHIAVRNARRVRFIGHEDQMVRQTLEPYPADAPAAALGKIPVPISRKSEPVKEKGVAVKDGGMKRVETKTAGTKNTEGAQSLRSVQEPALSLPKGWESRKPAHQEVPRKPPGRVTMPAVTQTNPTNADARSG